MRIEHEVCTHDPGDCAAGTDHRYLAARIEPGLRDGGDESADQIEHDETAVAETIFDVVAENPEEPHVARDMREAAVDEHRGEHVHDREVGRHQAVGIDKGFGGPRRQAGHEEEDQDVSRDDRHRDSWRRARRDHVSKRDHVRIATLRSYDMSFVRHPNCRQCTDLLQVRHRNNRASHRAATGTAPHLSRDARRTRRPRPWVGRCGPRSRLRKPAMMWPLIRLAGPILLWHKSGSK